MAKTIKLEVTFTVADDHDDNAVHTLAGCLVDYLTDSEYPLAEDYGPEAWGGYDGAIIVAASATATAGDHVVTRHETWRHD